MIVGFGPMMVLYNDEALFEWTCGEGQDGEVVGVHVPSAIANMFLVVEFGLRRAGDANVIEQLVASKKVPAPSWMPRTCSAHCNVAIAPPATNCGKCGSLLAPAPDVWQGGVDAASFQALANEHPIEWDVEVGDTIFVRVMNITGSNQHVSMGVRIGDGAVSKRKHWWANAETGKLERPMTFAERKLKLGARIGGLVVVDPETYDGFDRGTREGQAS